MEVGQTSTATPPALITAEAAKENASGISADFDTFLKMLTVQMKNQDPLNPVESSDFAVQLATFSGVEQTVLTNDLLKSLTAQMNSSGMAEMANWVGKEARAPAAAYFDGNPITFTPGVSPIADRAEVIVKDGSGNEVQRFAVPTGSQPVDWAGVTEGGYPFSAGLYSFEVASFANNELIEQKPIEIYSTVTEVRNQGGEYRLVLKGGAEIDSAEVTAIRDPAL